MSISYLNLVSGFLDHPKFVHADQLAPSNAIHLWLGLMSYCKEHQTDGFVPRSMVARVHGPTPRWRSRALAALETAGLIQVTAETVAVHDYLQWNFSKAQIKARSDARRDRRPGGSERSSERSSERMSERVANVAANVAANAFRVQSVSNDVGDLPADGRDHGDAHASRGRARSGSGLRLTAYGDPPSLPPKPEPEPPAQSASTSSAAKRRVRKPTGRTRCTEDWTPDDSTLAYATSLGFSPEQERKCRREFVNHWVGDGGLKANWQATYRNRLDKVAEWLKLEPPRPETPEQRAWRERRDRATKPPAKVAPDGREKVNGALAAMGSLFAEH